MKWLRIAAARVRGLLRRDAIEQDIDEELRSHLELATEANIERGLPPEEARRQALRSFGHMDNVKEAARDVRMGGVLEVLWQDLRFATRLLLKRPGFTLTAMTALALGIGANTAIFSVVNAVLLRPLPFPDPGRIVTLFETTREDPAGRGEFSYPNLADVRHRTRTLQYVATYLSSGTVLGGAEEPERVTGADVSADLFDVLGVEPMLGRVFTRGDDRPGQPRVVVLSHDFWRSHYGADPAVIGRPIKLAGDRTVIGVMPPGFRFPLDRDKPVQYWMPLLEGPPEKWLEQRDSHFLPVVARLNDGVSLEQALAELKTIGGALAAEYPSTNTGRGLRAVSLHEELARPVRPALLVLSGAVAFVLLIACANVANLLLAQAAGRSKEMALRTALGATRSRILRQLLVESLLLALLGGAAGLLLGSWGVDLLVRLAPAAVPRLGPIALDANVLAFTFIAAVGTGLFFGLVPALHASKVNLNDAMKDGAKGAVGAAGRQALRAALVVAEVALSLVLVIAAGLLMRSFWNVMTTDPGYDPNGVVVLDLPLSATKFPGPPQQAGAFAQLIERVSAAPGVAAAGVTTLLPLGARDIVYSFDVEGRPPSPPDKRPVARYQVVSASYFRTMKMSLRAGRLFDERDAAGGAQVVIVNESFVRRYMSREEVVGRRLVGIGEQEATRQIVGVVNDVRQLGLDSDLVPVLYIPYLQEPAPRMYLVARAASGSAADVMPSVRAAIREVNRNQLIWQTDTTDGLLSMSVGPRRFNMMLLAVFAIVALALAVVGIFAVVSYSVEQQRRETGIRIALGASPSRILRLVLGQTMQLTGVGVAGGLLAAVAMTRLMAGLLYQVSATDPLTFAAIALLLTLVALLAGYLPARRALRVDPVLALRNE